MSNKTERLLGFSALVLILISGAVLFIIRPENFSDPGSVEYVMKIVLYPSALVFIRFLWKSLLDNKIRGRAEREKEFKRTVDEEGREK